LVSNDISVPVEINDGPTNGVGRARAAAHFPRARSSNALSTANVIAATPVSMVGFGTGANSGE
jgi:hypothetical protein